MHEIKLEKTGITSISRLRIVPEKSITVTITFSESIAEPILTSVAKELNMPQYSVAESYITFNFDLTKFKKEDVCPMCLKYLKSVDEEVAKKVKPLEKMLLEQLEANR